MNLDRTVNKLLIPNELSLESVQQALHDLCKYDIEYGEIYFQSICSESWSIEESIVKKGGYSISQGMGVRAIVGEKTGFAYSDEISPTALRQTVKAAGGIARKGGSGRARILTEKSVKQLYLPLNPLESIEREQKIKILQEMDRYARNKCPQITQFNATISGTYENVLITASDGTLAGDIRPMIRISCSVVVKKGDRIEGGTAGGGGRCGYEFFFDTVGTVSRFISYVDEAIRIAMVNLESKAAPAGVFPVVLSAGWSGVLIHEAVGHGLESNFFRTGLTAQNTAVLGVSSGKTGMRFSVTDMRNKDILPHTNMSRDNFNLRVNTSAGPVDFDFTANYTREVVKNRPALGDSQSNVGKNLMTLAGTIDQSWLRNYENADGSYATWTGTSQYNKNPYWDLYKNDNNSTKDVFRFTGKAIWNIMDGLKLQGTIGTDINNMNFSEYIAKDTPGTKAGRLNNQIFNNRTLNAELLLLYNHSWENFDLNATLGGNYYRVDNKTTNNYGLGELIDNLPSIMNYGEQTVTENTYKKQINSLYASASVGYKHTYYLEGTLRGDKSSTLPVNNNTYVYPSVSGSIVFSEFIKNKKIINYGKVRASWAQVGSDTDPYQLALTYQNGMYKYPGYTIGMITNTTQPNKDLKPTMTSSYELGLEMKFFNNRLGLDVTYYNQNSRDQIISLASSSASSYERRLINAGEIQNKGIEVALNGRVLQIKDFAWDAGVNFSKNTNKVKKLVDGMNYFELEKAAWCGVSVGAQVGENYGCIIGKDFQRNENGDVIIDGSTGMPLVAETTSILGNASWDWTG